MQDGFECEMRGGPPQVFAEVGTSLLFIMLYCNDLKTETLHFSACTEWCLMSLPKCDVNDLP